MQAQEWALASLWENIGVHGLSSETGTPKAATSGGQKQLPSSSLPGPSWSSMAMTTISHATETTQESSKDGGKGLAKTPKPTSSSDDYMTSQRPLVPISTPGMCPASTTLPTHHHEVSWDQSTDSFPLSPSPMLSSPTFATRQTLQLGLKAFTHHLPNITSSTAMLDTMPSSIANLRELATKSRPPQLPITTPNRLQTILAKNRADRQQTFMPYPPSPITHHTSPPARPPCPAKDRLLTWRPLLSMETSPSGEDLKKCYQLTALAWEPSTLASYTSGL